VLAFRPKVEGVPAAVFGEGHARCHGHVRMPPRYFGSQWWPSRRPT